MINTRDNFLSEEDLDLRNLSEEELILYWNSWLEQAQATNDADANTYSHGVFVLMGSDLPVIKSRNRRLAIR
jgi:hypothetical protein